jgi:allantoate deiminase
MNAALIAAADRAVGWAGYDAPMMVSGAGHDAMIMAEKLPCGMIFVRSPGGISHNPDEIVLEQDVDAALTAGHDLLTDLAKSASKL